MKHQMKQMARQGDVLIISQNAKSLTEETKKRLFGSAKGKKWNFKTEGRAPLAYGEVSGHAHAIHDESAVQELTYSKDIQETTKQLKLSKEATVSHEEHGSVCIPKGEHAVVIQSEYRMGDIRRVID